MTSFPSPLWQTKAVHCQLRQAPYLETVVLMVAKAPSSIHERAVGCLSQLAKSPPARFELRPFAALLVDGLSRAASQCTVFILFWKPFLEIIFFLAAFNT